MQNANGFAEITLNMEEIKSLSFIYRHYDLLCLTGLVCMYIRMKKNRPSKESRKRCKESKARQRPLEVLALKRQSLRELSTSPRRGLSSSTT